MSRDLSFLTLPQYETELMGELRVPSGRGAVASDWHLPIVRESTVRTLIESARKNKATDFLAIPGDWFNMDVLSDHMPKQSDHDLIDEIIMSRKLMRVLLDIFDQVFVSMGNHDVRLMRSLGYKMRFEHSMMLCFGELPDRLRKNVKFTGRDYLLHDSPEGEWRFCHTNQYSRQQLSVPAALADKYRQHVLGAHRHHHAAGYSPSGYMIGELGCLADTERTTYLSRWSNSFPVWQQGFFLLLNGQPVAPLLHAPSGYRHAT